MKVWLAIAFTLFSTCLWATPYGAPITSDKPAVTLDQAITSLESKDIQNVLIEGEVVSVCQAKGCWMGLQNSNGDVRVTFKDYGFFVPLNVVGKTVKVEGSLSKIRLSLEETKHYVQDAGGDPDNVTEGKIEYRLVATGVEVL